MSEVTITMSPTVGKIAAALAKAQAVMGPAVKDAQNPHFKNRYATLAACFEAVRPLHEHGIAVLQPPMPHGTEGVCVATLLVHESGEWIRGELYMPAAKKDAQGFGSALSYARRYCLQATVGLATDDDDGEGARKGGGDLSSQLQQSVEENWPKWEEKWATHLRGADTVGALQEAWGDLYSVGRKLGAPADVMSRLTFIKDTRKSEMMTSGKANGARA